MSKQHWHPDVQNMSQGWLVNYIMDDWGQNAATASQHLGHSVEMGL